jgi:N-acetylmuramate 1-kinase
MNCLNSPTLFAQTNSRLAGLWKNSQTPERIVSLAGDASTRSYFRAYYEDGHTAIIMLQAHAGAHEEASFLEVHQFLQKLELPVPEILAHDADQSALLLEDLGDDLLEIVTARASEKEVSDLYVQAVDLLARMRDATVGINSGCRAFDLAFDEEKLMQEMNFFMTHFVSGLCRNNPSPSATGLLEEFFRRICRLLSTEPRIFTHRDFHSRNLILHGKRLVMIDFQDARMGPAQYDLASLLRDSYVSLQAQLVESLLGYYAKETGEADPGRFRYVFDVMSLQRNIKALGTFGYQASVRGSNRYLSSIPRTGAYIATNVALYPEFSRFRRVVEEFISGPAISMTR